MKINSSTYTNRLHQLFESTKPEDRFLTIQRHSLNPLERVDNEKILSSITDPTTGLPYDGIILQGEFASMDVLNNNGRKYVEENYLEFVEILKYQIHSPRGVYGELEHPEGYNVDYNNVSHKILDIWYNKEEKKVYGIILLLNTPKGLIAQQVVKSGGQIAVSARGGGSEVKNPDGSITALLKLLVTFDIVYHPGFTTATVDYIMLNECQEINIYEPNIKEFGKLYESFINRQKSLGFNPLFETNNTFYSWYNKNSEVKKLFESNQQIYQEEETQEEQQKQQQVLQKGQSSDEDEVEQDLEDAVDKDLSQEEQELQLKQNVFISQIVNNQQWLKKKIADKAYYTDNTAGFVDNSANYELGDTVN